MDSRIEDIFNYPSLMAETVDHTETTPLVDNNSNDDNNNNDTPQKKLTKLVNWLINERLSSEGWLKLLQDYGLASDNEMPILLERVDMVAIENLRERLEWFCFSAHINLQNCDILSAEALSSLLMLEMEMLIKKDTKTNEEMRARYGRPNPLADGDVSIVLLELKKDLTDGVTKMLEETGTQMLPTEESMEDDVMEENTIEENSALDAIVKAAEEDDANNNSDTSDSTVTGETPRTDDSEASPTHDLLTNCETRDRILNALLGDDSEEFSSLDQLTPEEFSSLDTKELSDLTGETDKVIRGNEDTDDSANDDDGDDDKYNSIGTGKTITLSQVTRLADERLRNNIPTVGEVRQHWPDNSLNGLVKNVTITQWNCNSLNETKCSCLLESANKFRSDIIAIAETKLVQDKSIAMIKAAGYDIIRMDRKLKNDDETLMERSDNNNSGGAINNNADDAGNNENNKNNNFFTKERGDHFSNNNTNNANRRVAGGVMLLYNPKRFALEEREDLKNVTEELQFRSSIEIAAALLHCRENSHPPIVVASLYNPPGRIHSSNDMSVMIQDLENFIVKYRPAIMVGDWNARHSNWDPWCLDSDNNNDECFRVGRSLAEEVIKKYDLAISAPVNQSTKTPENDQRIIDFAVVCKSNFDVADSRCVAVDSISDHKIVHHNFSDMLTLGDHVPHPFPPAFAWKNLSTKQREIVIQRLRESAKIYKIQFSSSQRSPISIDAKYNFISSAMGDSGVGMPKSVPYAHKKMQRRRIVTAAKKHLIFPDGHWPSKSQRECNSQDNRPATVSGDPEQDKQDTPPVTSEDSKEIKQDNLPADSNEKQDQQSTFFRNQNYEKKVLRMLNRAQENLTSSHVIKIKDEQGVEFLVSTDEELAEVINETFRSKCLITQNSKDEQNNLIQILKTMRGNNNQLDEAPLSDAAEPTPQNQVAPPHAKGNWISICKAGTPSDNVASSSVTATLKVTEPCENQLRPSEDSCARPEALSGVKQRMPQRGLLKAENKLKSLLVPEKEDAQEEKHTSKAGIRVNRLKKRFAKLNDSETVLDDKPTMADEAPTSESMNEEALTSDGPLPSSPKESNVQSSSPTDQTWSLQPPNKTNPFKLEDKPSKLHVYNIKKPNTTLASWTATQGCSNSIIPPITLSEMIAAVHGHNKNSTADHNGIDATFLSLLPDEFLMVLADLYQDIMTTGYWPQALKHAIVTPLLKPGKRADDRNSYRPVSVTLYLARTLERVAYKRINRTLQLSPEQFGFREGTGALEAMIPSIFQALDGFAHKPQLKSMLLALDFTDAFCRVSVDHVLNQYVKLNGDTAYLDFIKGFMTGRTQQVKIGNKLSRVTPLELGVPQGTVLGPLMFSIVCEHIIAALRTTMKEQARGLKAHFCDKADPNKVRRHSFTFYADDSVIVVSGVDPVELRNFLQECAATVTKKANELGLKISAKSSAILFSRRNDETPTLAPIEVDGILSIAIKTGPAATERFLGVTMSGNLRWKEQVEKAAERAMMNMNLIKKFGSKLTVATLRTLYLTKVFPLLSYGAEIWLPCISKDRLRLLERLHVSGGRMITGATESVTSHIDVLEEAGLPSLELLVRFRASYFIEKLFARPPECPARNRFFKDWWDTRDEITRRVYPRNNFFKDGNAIINEDFKNVRVSSNGTELATPLVNVLTEDWLSRNAKKENPLVNPSSSTTNDDQQPQQQDQEQPTDLLLLEDQAVASTTGEGTNRAEDENSSDNISQTQNTVETMMVLQLPQKDEGGINHDAASPSPVSVPTTSTKKSIIINKQKTTTQKTTSSNKTTKNMNTLRDWHTVNCTQPTARPACYQETRPYQCYETEPADRVHFWIDKLDGKKSSMTKVQLFDFNIKLIEKLPCPSLIRIVDASVRKELVDNCKITMNCSGWYSSLLVKVPGQTALGHIKAEDLYGTCDETALSFTAEQVGLLESARNFISPTTIQLLKKKYLFDTDTIEYVILTDSMSTLETLKIGPCRTTSYLQTQTWLALMNITRQGRRMKLGFIYSHCGYAPHDMVDMNAGRAAERDQTLQENEDKINPRFIATKLCTIEDAARRTLQLLRNSYRSARELPTKRREIITSIAVKDRRAADSELTEADIPHNMGELMSYLKPLDLLWDEARHIYRLRTGYDGAIGGPPFEHTHDNTPLLTLHVANALKPKCPHCGLEYIDPKWSAIQHMFKCRFADILWQHCYGLVYSGNQGVMTSNMTKLPWKMEDRIKILWYRSTVPILLEYRKFFLLNTETRSVIPTEQSQRYDNMKTILRREQRFNLSAPEEVTQN